MKKLILLSLLPSLTFGAAFQPPISAVPGSGGGTNIFTNSFATNIIQSISSNVFFQNSIWTNDVSSGVPIVELVGFSGINGVSSIDTVRVDSTNGLIVYTPGAGIPGLGPSISFKQGDVSIGSGSITTDWYSYQRNSGDGVAVFQMQLDSTGYGGVVAIDPANDNGFTQPFLFSTSYSNSVALFSPMFAIANSHTNLLIVYGSGDLVLSLGRFIGNGIGLTNIHLASLQQEAATLNQVVTWNGTIWIPKSISDIFNPTTNLTIWPSSTTTNALILQMRSGQVSDALVVYDSSSLVRNSLFANGGGLFGGHVVIGGLGSSTTVIPLVISNKVSSTASLLQLFSDPATLAWAIGPNGEQTNVNLAGSGSRFVEVDNLGGLHAVTGTNAPTVNVTNIFNALALTLREPTNSWAGPSANIDLALCTNGTATLDYTTTADCTVSGFINKPTTNDAFIILTITNSTSTDHTLTLPGPVTTDDGLRVYTITNKLARSVWFHYSPNNYTNGSSRLWY